MKLFIVFYKSGCSGIVLKLDYEKAYDRVNCDFLLDTLRKRGFGFKCVSWIRRILHNGSVGVQVNNVEGEYFETGKGLRQGDPLSPILFHFAADCLARMVRKAQRANLITGLAENLIPGGVILLQYVDDTIVCLQNDMTKARNMKLLLCFYEMMPGLKINFSKSEIIMNHGDDSLNTQYADLFNCQIGSFSLKYLGVPISHGRLHIKDWLP